MSSDDDSAEAETPSGFSEVGREVREAERALAAKRTEYDELVKTAQSEYDRSTTSLFFVKIRRFDKLVKALDFVRISRAHVPMAIFARSKPKPDNTSMVLRTVKEYLVAPYQNFWQYCLRVDFGVMLEECIRVDQPTYLHFDIEIKCLRVEDIPTVAFSEVLKTQLELIDHVLPTELLDAIGLNHDAVCIDPLTEEECRAGLKIMLEHIRLFLRDHIEQPYQDPDFRIDPDYRIDPDFRIVSGCRPSKLSFHVVCKGLLVDSNVGSMSLLVYEIARSFAISNLQALYDCEFRRDDGDAENRFRYRALMLSQAVTSLPMPEQHGDEHDERLLEATDAISWGFTGYDDTPIDEAIYSKNHLLRAPGACKVDTSALHPVVDVNNDPLMVEERKFSNLFPPTNQGFLAWCEQLIGFPRVGDVRQDVLLTGMKPTESCPFSRRWYSQVGDSAEAPPTNICPLVRYSGSYFQEKRPMIREIRGLYSHEIRNAIDGSGSALTSFHERVAPDEVFMAEDGRSKAFRLFNPGDWLFHVHGGARERTPSAKVFFGGFRCFGCNTSFAVPQSTPWEAAYPFLAEETVTSRDPKQFMPDLDWVALLQRKFVVINANMGSGKTEQLVRLVKVAEQEDRTVLVVSFRRFLATQQAKRLDILCYLDLSPAELGAGPKMLTLVLNSLLKIGEEAYNIVVLDECGLIRRHFFSRTMVNILPAVYKAYRRVLQTADNVIMLQDGLTRNDIQFHTEIDNVDCEDRSKVSAYSFEKPVEIHPLQCTTDFYMALQNLRECYRTACKDKTMEHPFMVMCNSAVVAEFLVCQLRETAKAEGTKPERIQGIWARIKARSEFCRRFSEDPNGVASEVDVIVCTSVIGAGFSINCHFQSFHAFLLTDILTFLEEQQFLQRLRWIMANCPTNAIRQSYLYVQKGHGRPFEYERVQVNFDTVRKVLLRATGVDGRRRSTLVDTADNEMLAETHARIETERAASRSMHDDLWRNYGTDVLQSPFVVLEPSEEESAQAKKELQREFLEWARKRIKDVKTFIDLTDSENLGEHDLGEHIAAVECAAGMELFIQSNADAVVADLEGCFGRFLKPLKYIVNLTFDEKKATKLLTGPSARQTWISGVKGMVSQLTSLYSNLVPGQSKHRWQTMQERGFNTSTLKRTAHLVLAEHVLHGVLGVGGTGELFQICPGATPFFQGARFLANEHLCEYFKRTFEATEDDTPAIKEHKTILRRSVLVVVHQNDRTESALPALYNETRQARRLVKIMLSKIGVKLTTLREGDGARRMVNVVAVPDVNLAVALCFDSTCKTYRRELVQLIPMLMEEGQMETTDKDLLSDARRLFLEACTATDTDPCLPGRSHSHSTARAFMPLNRYRQEEVGLHTARGAIDGMGTEYEYDGAGSGGQDEAELRDAQEAAERQFGELAEADTLRAQEAATRVRSPPREGNRRKRRKRRRDSPRRSNIYVEDQAAYSSSDSSDGDSSDGDSDSE